MPKFLNTAQLTEWIGKLIDDTEKELILLVPYIQLSNSIYSKLQRANARGVETVLVYRENKLTEKEKKKLVQLDNLNLLHHPNLHAKCYYNESYLIIGSMNLYEYSEKNNREMGILLSQKNDPSNVFQDAITEIKDVINSAELLIESRETKVDGFELDIIKTDFDICKEYCDKLNFQFKNKFFFPKETNGEYNAYCLNYIDNVDVQISHRVSIIFKQNPEHIDFIYKTFETRKNEFMYDGFKFYWNNYGKDTAYLYSDKSHQFWINNPNDDEKYAFIKYTLKLYLDEIKCLLIVK